MKMIISAVACILSAPVSTVAIAQPTENASVSEMVSYADLHLDSARDRERLEWRVHAVAERLCMDDNGAAPVAYVNSGCYRAAMADAHRQMERAIARARGEPALVLARSGKVQMQPR
jgi:UrcA family protein